jgi:hypothetical protein
VNPVTSGVLEITRINQLCVIETNNHETAAYAFKMENKMEMHCFSSSKARLNKSHKMHGSEVGPSLRH